jgi:cytoskeletal protein RodZ
LSTDTKLALVVGALVLVGVGIALLTYFYWRHTRPQQYMSALDALADVEQSVPRGGDVPTAEQPAVGSSTATAAGAAAGATTAVKILDDPKPAVVDEPTQITTLEDLEAPDTSKKD